MKILVTGAKGFIGKNLISVLARRSDWMVWPIDIDSTADELSRGLAAADFIFHLAGVNRPQDEHEFETSNADLTAYLCDRLSALGKAVPLVLPSSIQATLDNPYGVSKRKAEDVVSAYAERSGARVMIYRLKNVFGKWCRPNYNSVVATFCYNIARDLPVTISDPNKQLELVYIDDVIQHFAAEIESSKLNGAHFREVTPVYTTTLGGLAALIHAFRQMRQTLLVPDLSDAFTKKLYGTFVSYLEPNDFAYPLDKKPDARGCLAEFIKSAPFGQIFVSRTHPGITRGNHYHHTKAEKFLVVEGEAVIRFRSIRHGDVIEYHVRGEDLRVVDIPPGYTHSIENIGSGELVTLFWASEEFDPDRPDTNALNVFTE